MTQEKVPEKLTLEKLPEKLTLEKLPEKLTLEKLDVQKPVAPSLLLPLFFESRSSNILQTTLCLKMRSLRNLPAQDLRCQGETQHELKTKTQ
ncbi:hypothetical protein DMENIID0001_095160 [Sergentomyia squamirostris]